MKYACQYFSYACPQENGYQTDVRWMELRHNNDWGLRISGAPQFGFTALHYPMGDFVQMPHDDFRHTSHSTKNDSVFVNFDLKQMGVAGDNSWGARPYEEYSIPAQNNRFEFTLAPVLLSVTSPEQARTNQEFLLINQSINGSIQYLTLMYNLLKNKPQISQMHTNK